MDQRKIRRRNFIFGETKQQHPYQLDNPRRTQRNINRKHCWCQEEYHCNQTVDCKGSLLSTWRRTTEAWFPQRRSRSFFAGRHVFVGSKSAFRSKLRHCSSFLHCRDTVMTCVCVPLWIWSYSSTTAGEKVAPKTRNESSLLRDSNTPFCSTEMFFISKIDTNRDDLVKQKAQGKGSLGVIDGCHDDSVASNPFSHHGGLFAKQPTLSQSILWQQKKYNDFNDWESVISLLS